MKNTKKMHLNPFEDNRMSLKAKGLMAYLQTKPEHTFKELFDSTPDGMTTNMRAIKDCELHDWLVATNDRKVYIYEMGDGTVGKLYMED